jgi:hypothetical protein
MNENNLKRGDCVLCIKNVYDEEGKILHIYGKEYELFSHINSYNDGYYV